MNSLANEQSIDGVNLAHVGDTTADNPSHPLSGPSSDSRYTYIVQSVWSDSTTADSIEVPLIWLPGNQKEGHCTFV